MKGNVFLLLLQAETARQTWMKLDLAIASLYLALTRDTFYLGKNISSCKIVGETAERS